MNKSQFVFKVVDVVCEKSQNPYDYDNIYCVKDIAFSDFDEKMTCGDLYFDPLMLKDGTKHPIILNIHGGGFVMGDKQYRKSLCEYYASKGYYVYNINYRMPPDVDIMGCIQDCIDAANYIPTLAEDYNIDLNKIVVTGDSSGAYLASYIAAVKFDPSIADATGLPNVDIDIASLILHSGPYDMEKMMKEKIPFKIIPELASMLVGYKLQDDLSDLKYYKYYDYISPINMVNNNWCPAFISWSNSDFVCENQGRPMAEKLMKCCPKVSTYYANGMTNGHCFHLTMKKDISMQCIENSIEFTNMVLAEAEEKAKNKAKAKVS
ncbi:MAG: alpha/beta hydrolase [Clostridiales bacterium]|nr:alpha/beta hydrolase [Clostridiales bacterium]